MRTLVLALAAAVLLPAAATAAPRPAAPDGWAGTPGGVAGVARTADGEWAWQDFVYDDGGRLDNAADLVELRLRPRGDDLDVRVTLNTLRATDAPVVGLALAGPDAAARPWPGSAGVISRWDAFATATPDGAVVERAEGTVAEAPVVVDLDENTIAFTVPGGAVADRLDVVAGAGRWDATAARWDGGVVDLATNAHEVEAFGKGSWRDEAQRAAVTAGDVAPMAAAVDLAAVRSGATADGAPADGLVNRVYRSRQRLGEGYGSAFPRHRGLYQPSTVWVPAGYDPARARPLALVLHSLNNTHNEYSATNVYRHLAGDALALTPLALGTNGWYWDEALVDVLDAWADVRGAYAVDEDRTTVAGYSMGGYGTYRLVTMLPDRFAAGAVWAGVPAHQIWAAPADPVPAGDRQQPGNTSQQLEAARHVPLLISHGANDQLVPITGVLAQAQRLDELGFEHRLNVHPGFDHYTFRTLDDWRREGAWLAGRRRVDDPARVSMVVRPASWVTAGRPAVQRAELLSHLQALGADLASAYWVHDVVPVAGADPRAVVDLTSSGRTLRDEVSAAVAGARTDYPVPYVQKGRRRGLASLPSANALSGTVSGATALTVDLQAAGLSLEGLALDVVVDRTVELTLLDGAVQRVVQLHP